MERQLNCSVFIYSIEIIAIITSAESFKSLPWNTLEIISRSETQLSLREIYHDNGYSDHRPRILRKIGR